MCFSLLQFTKRIPMGKLKNEKADRQEGIIGPFRGDPNLLKILSVMVLCVVIPL